MALVAIGTTYTKLEVGIAGADVVERAHDAFQDKTNTHGIVDTKVLWNSVSLRVRYNTCRTRECGYLTVYLTSKYFLVSAFRILILYQQCLCVMFYFYRSCLLYTSPSPRDATLSRMPSSA